MLAAQDVLTVVECLQQAGVQICVDGGWGIDALVGEQTRDHDDLDCVIALEDAPVARDALARLGFAVTDDEQPTRFVVRDEADRRVDFHTVTFDEEGGGVQRLQDGSSWRYPPQGLTAMGQIAGRTVPYISAETQVLSHLGYDPDEQDRHDMWLLAERFGIDLPEPYRR